MRSANLYSTERTYPQADCLFFKFQGPTPASIQETARIVKEVVKKHGATGFELARTEKEANDLWAARKNALYSGLARLEGSKGWGTDVWSVSFFCGCGVVDLVSHSTVFQSRGSLTSSMKRNRIFRNSGSCPILWDTSVMVNLRFSLRPLIKWIRRQAISMRCSFSGVTKSWRWCERLYTEWSNEP